MGSPRLEEVFGISGLRTYSYIDRGSLDAKTRYKLGTGRHLVIHGDSKQGKSWLRETVLPEAEAIRVQCRPNGDTASVLQEALGILGVRAELRTTVERKLGGTIDLGASGEAGLAFFTKAKAEGKFGLKAESNKATESAPIGRSQADLAWVAFLIHSSGRRLVLEDFHYLSEQEQRQFSFLIKALGEDDVQVVVVGVWAEDHLLSFYHNGDLATRVEDVKLEWSLDELRQVLLKGATALNASFSLSLLDSLTADAFANIGVLQRLAERVCYEHGLLKKAAPTVLDCEQTLDRARRELAGQLAVRFSTWSERLSNGSRSTFQDVLQVLMAATDAELTAGLSLPNLVQSCNSLAGSARYSRRSLRDKLLGLSKAQARAEVFPPVVSYDQVGNKLFLVDRALLFYRKYGDPQWDWEL